MAQAEAEARERGETGLPHRPNLSRHIRDAQLTHALNPEPEPPPAAHQPFVASAHGSHDEWAAVFGDYQIRLAPRRPASSTTASVEKAHPQPSPSEGPQGGDGESETVVGTRPALGRSAQAEESIEQWLDDLDSDVEELSNVTQSAMTGVSSDRGSTRPDASSSTALLMNSSLPSALAPDALGTVSVSRTLCDSRVSGPLDASQDLASAPRETHLRGQPMPPMPSALATALDSDMGRGLLRNSMPGLRTGTGTTGVDRFARIGRLIGAPLHSEQPVHANRALSGTPLLSERRPDQPSAITAAGTRMDFTSLIGRVAPPDTVGTDAGTGKYAAAEAAAAFKGVTNLTNRTSEEAAAIKGGSSSEQSIAIRSAVAEMEALKPKIAPRCRRDGAEMEALKPKLGACDQSSLEHPAADARDDARRRLEALEKAAREAAELRRQLAERGYKSCGVHMPPPLLSSHQPPASAGGSHSTGGFPHSTGGFGGCAVRGSVFSASDFGGSPSGGSELGGSGIGGSRHHSFELGGGTEVGGSVTEVGGGSGHGGLRSTHAPLSIRSPI